MPNRNKIRIALFSGGVLVALIILSASLSGFELAPGDFVLFEGLFEPGEALQTLRIPLDIMTSIWRFTLLAMMFLLPLGLILAIVRPEVRGQVIRNALFLTLAAIAYFIIMKRRGFDRVPSEVPPEAGNLPSRPEIVPDSLVTSPPEWLTFLIAAVVICLLIFVAWFVWRRFLQPMQDDSLEKLAWEAQEALDSLRGGGDLKDTILRCYRDMSVILSRTVHLQRKESMTPREFEIGLRRSGLPNQHINDLTRLFETVRYGAHAASPQEEARAIACLEAIVQAC